MTNSQIKRNNFITPEKASILLPTIISSLFAVILFSAFSIPKFVASNKINNELNEFKRKANDLPNLKTQSKEISKKLEKLNIKKEKIIELISGTTNLETFISRLGFIADKNNIKILSIKPKSSIKFVNSGNSETQDELGINPDRLLVEGVKKYTIDLSLNASYSDLLIFIKQLELQENIILFEEINIELKNESDLSNSKGKIPNLAANLKIKVYGKI